MTGDYTEGVGGLPLAPGVSLRAIGPARRPALDAAERLEREHPGAEVRAVRLRAGDGVEAIVGHERMAGTVAEVGKWLAGQAPAAGSLPGVPAAGTDG